MVRAAAAVRSRIISETSMSQRLSSSASRALLDKMGDSATKPGRWRVLMVPVAEDGSDDLSRFDRAEEWEFTAPEAVVMEIMVYIDTRTNGYETRSGLSPLPGV